MHFCFYLVQNIIISLDRMPISLLYKQQDKTILVTNQYTYMQMERLQHKSYVFIFNFR